MLTERVRFMLIERGGRHSSHPTTTSPAVRGCEASLGAIPAGAWRRAAVEAKKAGWRAIHKRIQGL
jgi:hypothetical protein